MPGPEYNDRTILPPHAPLRAPIRNLAFAVIVVVSSAAVAAGSCSGHAGTTVDSYASQTFVGSVLLPALLSAGLALGVSFGYVLLVRPLRPAPVGVFVTTNVTSYIAGMIGAWWVVLLPVIAALAVIIAGGLLAAWVWSKIDEVAFPWRIAGLSCVAIALAAVAFVSGFWVNYDMRGQCFTPGWGTCTTTFNAFPFAIIAGVVPPLCAAGVSWWLTRWDSAA